MQSDTSSNGKHSADESVQCLQYGQRLNSRLCFSKYKGQDQSHFDIHLATVPTSPVYSKPCMHLCFVMQGHPVQQAAVRSEGEARDQDHLSWIRHGAQCCSGPCRWRTASSSCISAFKSAMLAYRTQVYSWGTTVEICPMGICVRLALSIRLADHVTCMDLHNMHVTFCGQRPLCQLAWHLQLQSNAVPGLCSLCG